MTVRPSGMFLLEWPRQVTPPYGKEDRHSRAAGVRSCVGKGRWLCRLCPT